MTSSSLVHVDMGDQRTIVVEAVNVDPERPVGIRDVLSFEGVSDSIEVIAERVTRALENARPDKATVEFGVEIGVEGGGLTALIAKGTGSAHLNITLEWTPAAADGQGG